MLISELSKKSGLPIDTLRFYEKKGLIDAEMVERKTNNYRTYSEQSLERLVLIQQAKRLGFTLAEIQEWIESFESDSPEERLRHRSRMPRHTYPSKFRSR